MRQVRGPTKKAQSQKNFHLTLHHEQNDMKTEKQTKTTTAPLSIDKAAQILKTDRRTLTQALQQAEQLDFITPHDFRGVRGCARYLLPDACEALELWRVRQAPLDMRRHCERMGNDYARALSMP